MLFSDTDKQSNHIHRKSNLFNDNDQRGEVYDGDYPCGDDVLMMMLIMMMIKIMIMMTTMMRR